MSLKNNHQTRFQSELQRLGPDRPPSAWGLAESQKYCRNWARSSYENFTVVSFLLPRHVRQDFYNVYAFCRWSDDLADEVEGNEQSLKLLNWWQQQLSLCFSGRPAHPVMVALQRTIQEHAIPIKPFSDLISAFRQDQSIFRYESDAQLVDYCTRSADPVGEILLRLAGAFDDETSALSHQVCTGLQLANFCQDMERDAKIDRIYAPRSHWETHNVDEAMLLKRKVTPQLRSLVRAWVDETRRYFERGRPLVQLVPRWLATDIDLFIRGGVEVLDAIERQDYDVWTNRPTVTKSKKVKLLARSLLTRITQRSRPTTEDAATK